MFAWIFMIHAALVFCLCIWKTKPSSNLYGLVSIIKNLLLSVPRLTTSQVTRTGAKSHGCSWMLSGFCSCQACYQWFRLTDIFPGPWLERTASETLISMAGTGQRSASWSSVRHANGRTVTRYADKYGSCVVLKQAPVRSLGSFLGKIDHLPPSMAVRSLNWLTGMLQDLKSDESLKAYL